MTLLIRPFTFTRSDYAACVQLRNRLYADTPATVEMWQRNDRLRRQDRSYHFFVAERETGLASHEIIGYVQCAKKSSQSRTVGLGMVCAPTCWQNGVARQLLDKVKQIAAEFKAADLVQKVQESDEQKLSFFLEQGFTQVMRYPLSVLDVGRFDGGRFQNKWSQMEGAAIEVKQLPLNWQDDLTWQKLVYHLDWTLTQDVPYHDKRVQEPFESYIQNEIFHPNAFPESYFAAWDADRPVGMTCFIKRGGGIQTVSTALTGVIPAYRRRGIAFALKLASIRFARAAGIETILTHNEENNPMFHLNQRLGFTQKPAWLDLKYSL